MEDNLLRILDPPAQTGHRSVMASLLLPLDTMSDLEALSRLTKCSKSEIMRKAIQHFLASVSRQSQAPTTVQKS